MIYAALSEVETALSFYSSLSTTLPFKPIWAVAENYRFEPAFVEVLNASSFGLLDLLLWWMAC